MKTVAIDSDLHVLCCDVDPLSEPHQQGSDCVWAGRRELIRDLTSTREQSPMLDSVVLRTNPLNLANFGSLPKSEVLDIFQTMQNFSTSN